MTLDSRESKVGTPRILVVTFENSDVAGSFMDHLQTMKNGKGINISIEEADYIQRYEALKKRNETLEDLIRNYGPDNAHLHLLDENTLLKKRESALTDLLQFLKDNRDKCMIPNNFFNKAGESFDTALSSALNAGKD